MTPLPEAPQAEPTGVAAAGAALRGWRGVVARVLGIVARVLDVDAGDVAAAPPAYARGG